jgi:hypothetical protein
MGGGWRAIMKDTKSFDADLQMFRETLRAVNLAHLRFLRWLVEEGRLEHGVAGVPAGELAEQATVEERLAAAS